jgi:hypothetical protein
MKTKKFSVSKKFAPEYNFTITSVPGGGCGLENCNCSPGFWLSRVKPSEEKKRHGEILYFKSDEELQKYIQENNIIVDPEEEPEE